MINENGMFLAEVRNIKDPYKSGRFQIRIYGHQSNEQGIQDQYLSWAQFLHHAGSAATSKIGMIPTGPIVGSRVMGFFLDKGRRVPVILGTFPRGGQLDDTSKVDSGQDNIKQGSQGIDCPVVGGPPTILANTG